MRPQRTPVSVLHRQDSHHVRNSAVVAEELLLYSSLCRLLQSKGHQSRTATTHLILTLSATYLNVLKKYLDEKIETLPSGTVPQTATDTKVHTKVA